MTDPYAQMPESGPSSTSPSGRSRSPPGHAHGAKKPRSAAACESCRQRKLGCSGGQPCQRCAQENRECIPADLPVRSPLTRVRMTELETKIELHERLWSALFPGFSLDSACQRARQGGIEAVRAVADQIYIGRQTCNDADKEDWPTSAETTDTRSSPQNQGFDDPFPRAHGPYEWHEDGQPLDGMGSSPLESMSGGRSYLGLSSGSTFHAAIKRLIPAAQITLSPHVDTSPSSMGSTPGDGDRGGRARLPPVAPTFTPQLPPLEEIAPLVDSYFKYFHTLAPLVHEPSIRAQIEGRLPLVARSGSEILLYMIFAMGEFDLGVRDGSQYYHAARTGLDFLTEGSLPIVQSITIMSNYLQRSGRPNAGYLCLGIAIRMAVGLGLHDPPDRAVSPFDAEMHSRVCWAICTLEAGCAVTFGRPPGVSPPRALVLPVPLNVHDRDLRPGATYTPRESTDITVYTALVTQSRLAAVTLGIHERILLSRVPSIEELRKYDTQLCAVIDALPHHSRSCTPGPFRLARSVQVWRARDFRAILYRPLLLSAAMDVARLKTPRPATLEAIDTCRTLALLNLAEIRDYTSYQSDYSRGVEWYTIFFAYQSCLTALVCIISDPRHPAVAACRQALRETIAWFRLLGSMRAYANNLESSLAHLLPAIPAFGDTVPRVDSSVAQKPLDVTGLMHDLYGGAWEQNAVKWSTTR